MTKTEAIERLDALSAAVENAAVDTLDVLAAETMADLTGFVVPTPDVAHAERQAKARIGFLERAIRSNGAAASTNDIEKLRRRASRAIIAWRDAVALGQPVPSTTAA